MTTGSVTEIFPVNVIVFLLLSLSMLSVIICLLLVAYLFTFSCFSAHTFNIKICSYSNTLHSEAKSSEVPMA